MTNCLLSELKKAFSSGSGGVVNPALFLVYAAKGAGIAEPVTQTFAVAGLLGGAEEDVGSGAMYLDSSDYELMMDGQEQIVMVNFPNVDIPQVRVAQHSLRMRALCRRQIPISQASPDVCLLAVMFE